MAEKFLSTQPYKGTRDFYPADMRIRNWIFSQLQACVQSYGYQEYDGPLLEPFELYAAKSGEEIVNQQLYWLMDRGERKMAIRPEMTPTLARMIAAKVHELPKPIRWFSFPNLWRYEKPQRGRLREHWQLNIDVLGGDSLLADSEVLLLAQDLLRIFKGEKFVSIHINNRKLIDFFFTETLGLSPEVALKWIKAIDARAKIGEDTYLEWLGELGIKTDQIKQLEDFFTLSLKNMAQKHPCPGSQELVELFSLLEDSESQETFVFDPKIMRGLNYYTGTVFEMYDTSPENRRALFGGGRYDNLIGLFGKTQLSGVGFGMGDVTFKDFLEVHGLLPTFDAVIDVFVTLPSPDMRILSQKISRELRKLNLKVMTPLEYSGFGAQLKMASKHQARFAVLFGEAEMLKNEVIVKDLSKGTQTSVPHSKVAEEIASWMKR